MDDVDVSLRFKLFPDDPAPLAAESVVLEDGYYAALRAELEGDAQDLEAESWSVAVDQQYLKSFPKEAVKRQDVIYELIQTELNHVRTLKLLLGVYQRALRDALQMDEAKLERLFPRAAELLQLHQRFLARLKQRRQQALEPDGGGCNYCIAQLGDILISQFSGELGDRMKECYSVFCSHHSDAVSFYKEQLQNNKKFQNVIRKIGQLSIVRRLGVPECILLVTQRITKYPVLVERIIQNTEEPEEQEALEQALALIKHVISQVDAQVDEHEKASRLRDVAARLEPKSQGRLKDGRPFRREDMTRRTLLHEGVVTSKAASGRLKDIHAVLLSDVLLLLQEKDQKFTFAVVDNKPSVISLQGLIVREVALEDRAMFLICASSTLPEMYEIRARTKEDRETWMTVIRGAVDSCPEMEEWSSEQEEARAVRLRDFQERLYERDVRIVQSLTEKLQIFAELSEAPEEEAEPGRPRLLLRGDASDLQQGEQLLKGAITEVGNLQNLLVSRVRDPYPRGEDSEGHGEGGALIRRAETFGGFDSDPTTTPVKNGGGTDRAASVDDSPAEGLRRSTSDPQLQDPDLSESVELSADETPLSHWTSPLSDPFPEEEFHHSVLMLSKMLYSLQAVVSLQDSHVELQRALLSERQRPVRPRGSVLLEQEKQRSLEKQREELARFHRQQAQHRQEQTRWEREVERQRQQAEATEARLLQQGEELRRLEERLAEERAELQGQREEYQRDLERLRETTIRVGKERERMEQQKRFRKNKSGSDFDGYAQPLSSSQSLRGDVFCRDGDFILGPKARARPLLPMPTTAGGGVLELPPEVPPRRESISPLPAKAEVPIHLVSTTNQAHKPGHVQQQIPTKLAAVSKGKDRDRGGKARGAHQRTHSAASIDMSQVLPIRVTGRDGGSLRGQKTESPPSICQPGRTPPEPGAVPGPHNVSEKPLDLDRFSPPEPLPNVKPSQPFSFPPLPPPFPKEVGKPVQERVVFL